MINVIDALIILGCIMILGFIGNYIFNKTQIPSIVWLLLFGLLIGIGFNIRGGIPEDILITVSEFFAAIAIVIILFDGGIQTDLYQLFKGAPRGLMLTITGFLLSLITTLAVVVILAFFNIIPISIEQSLIVGAILGAIIGGTSSPIVIPLASRLKNLQEKTKMVLSIESIITDPLSIVVVLAGIYIISTETASLWLGIRSLAITFSVGIVLGLVFGFIWLPIMHKVRKEQFSYVLTLAVVFLVYSITALMVGVGEGEGGTGAGAIACLMFGLVLGNGKKVLKMINYPGKGFEMDQQTKQFHSLTSFVIRTFFFVYLGMMVSFQKIEFIIVGIVIVILLLIIRFLAVKISTHKGNFEKDDQLTMTTMMPRGLAAAILAISFSPLIVRNLNLGVVMNGFFEDVIFVVILGTAIITTVGVSVIGHLETKKVKEMNNTNKYNQIEKMIKENDKK